MVKKMRQVVYKRLKLCKRIKIKISEIKKSNEVHRSIKMKIIQYNILKYNTKSILTFGIAQFCREEGIRTLDTVAHILPFQGSSFNHSDTSLFNIFFQKN
jgi:hypothetical protein